MFDNLRGGLRALFRRRESENELDDELRDYLEHAVDKKMQLGMSHAEALRAARAEFGSVEAVKDYVRDAGWESVMKSIWSDMRFAARLLRKSPGFAAVAVVTIALGVGATTAIFSVVNATLLDPLPYPHPKELVSIQDDLLGVGARDVGLSQPEWQDLEHSGIFEHVSPAWFDENNLTGSSQPARVNLLIVAPNYFALLGVKPQLGRIFDPSNYTPGFTGEVLISDGLWKRNFGSDPQILGRSLRLDTDLYRIVGVMPLGFHSPARTAAERNAEVWAATSFYGLPLPDHPPRNKRNLPEAIARIKPGLTLAEAQSRLDALVATLQKQYPADYPPQNAWTVRLVPLKQTVVGNVRQSLILLLGAVALVLLIGCVNIANLLLARASARGREIAIRQALGAARARLIRQLLTESLLLALLGGIVGLAILFSAKQFLFGLVPATLPRLNEVSINWEVLLFAVLLTLAVGLIFGLAPALQADRFHSVGALKEAARGSTGSREYTRRVLVITEFALSLVLMTAACLLLRSFWNLLNTPLGFKPESAMTVRTRLPYPNDPKMDKYATAAQEAPFVRELLRRGKMLPGVEEVALGDSGSIPLNASQRELNRLAGRFFFTLEGRDIQSNQSPVVDRWMVTPGYFHLLGIPLLRGRLFDEFDGDKTPPVAVVNESFARTYWPNENALGKRFRRDQAGSPWITVVGVIANARTESLAESDVPQIYLSLYQTGTHHLAIFLRGHLDPSAISRGVREQVQSLDPTLPVFAAQTINQEVAESLSQRRFSLQMVGLFALTALLLAALGIYGVMSYMVSERTHEIGIRLALGASRANVVKLVLRQALRLASAGVGVGLVGALIVSHVMVALLYGVRSTDPETFGSVALLLVGVGLLACYLPVRRATRVDPIVALRFD